MARTAAALIIGNEILTGKIREANLWHLARELRLLGVVLRRVVLCLDDEATIVEELRALHAAHDIVFTSGGVGPTPDDVTLPAVAKALGRPLVRAAAIEARIRDHWGERVTAGHLRMADVPEGAELIANEETPWPVIFVDGVAVMPGVPEIFRIKLRLLRDRIGADAPFVSRALYTQCDEGTIAGLLEQVGAAYPDVEIGSYPLFRREDYRTKLTFDGLVEANVLAALAACRSQIAAELIVREE